MLASAKCEVESKVGKFSPSVDIQVFEVTAVAVAVIISVAVTEIGMYKSLPASGKLL